MKTYTAKEIGKLALDATTKVNAILRASKEIYIDTAGLRKAREALEEVIDHCAEQIAARRREEDDLARDDSDLVNDIPF